MSNEIDREELLDYLEQAHKYFTFEPPERGKQAYEQIVALVKKTQVTDEWIRAKARAMCDAIDGSYAIYPAQAESFIRSLVEEIGGK